MTRVELLDNMRMIIGLYVVDVLHHPGGEPWDDCVRFTLVTLPMATPTWLYSPDSHRVEARFFNMGKAAVWIGISEPDLEAKRGLPLTAKPKDEPCGGNLVLPPEGAQQPMCAWSEEGGYLFVIERRTQ